MCFCLPCCCWLHCFCWDGGNGSGRGRSWRSAQGQRRRPPCEFPPRRWNCGPLQKFSPVYPEEARLAGTQGLEVLDAVIAPDGTVKRLRPVSGDELLVKSAAAAVRSWRFEPYQSVPAGLAQI